MSAKGNLMNMDLETLISKLDELGWEEQMVFEMSERQPDAFDGDYQIIEERIRRLGRQLTPQILNDLQREPGYLVWVLRLSQHVPGDDSIRRARRWRSSDDSQVRYWAEEILGKSTG